MKLVQKYVALIFSVHFLRSADKVIFGGNFDILLPFILIEVRLT